MTEALDRTDEAEMLAFARGAVGPCRPCADHSWPHRQAIVLELVDATGRLWIAKRSRVPAHHRNETTAYREWAPALSPLSPRMIAWDDERSIVLLTREPGAVGTRAAAENHRRAGALIRRFHDAAPPRPAADFVDVLTERAEVAARAVGGLFRPGQLAVVRGRIRALRGIGPLSAVPTHQDNQPRNWLVDAAGIVRLIDFGLSTWDVWVRDLVRLSYWDWADDPTLGAAFWSGYERELSEEDGAVLAALGGVVALRTVLWARDHGDPSFADRGWRTLEILEEAR